ncbi:MAG: response regulator [Succinivibrio sp.]|nr:response regulator [Succinivibrio sp.]
MIDLEDVHILIVDDDELIVKMASDIISSRLPYKVHAVNSGVECLNFLNRRIPQIDLLLVDVFMPGMDGFETLSKARQVLGYERVPVVLLTAATDRETVIKASQLQVQGYVKKPFNANVLAEKVASVIMKTAFEE